MKLPKCKGLLVLSIFLCFSLLACSDTGRLLKYKEAQRAHNSGDYKKAIEIYKEMIKKEPDDEMLRYELGVAYLDDSNFSGAQRQIEKLKEMDREDLAEELQKLRRRARVSSRG